MTSGIRLAATAAVLAAMLGLGGCADNRVEITAGTGALMQSTVVVAANQAATGDTAGALTTLDSLQAQLRQASATGDISADRATAIQHAIDLVRTDLQPTPVEAPAPEKTTTPETTAPVTTTDPIVGDTTDGSPDTGNNGDGNNGKKDKEKEKEQEKEVKEKEKAEKEKEKEKEQEKPADHENNGSGKNK